MSVTDDQAESCARIGCSATDLIDPTPFCEKHVREVKRCLWDLPDLYLELRQALVPSSGAGSERVSGSREAPLPLVTAALALADDIAGWLIDQEDMLRAAEGFTAAGRTRRYLVRHAIQPVTYYEGTDRVMAEKSVRELSAEKPPVPVTLLATTPATEPLRRDALRHPDEAGQVTRAARFLRAAADKLLGSPPAADVGNELLDLQHRALAALGQTDGSTTITVPCPSCGHPFLVRYDGSDEVVCPRTRGGCGEVRDNLPQLVRIAASELSALRLSTIHAAQLLSISPSTISKWVERGRLTPAAHDPKNGRPLYNVSDILALAKTLTPQPKKESA